MAKKITYKSSGVDIEKASQFIDRIKTNVKSTFGPGVLQDKKAFGSLFAFDNQKYKDPILVSSTDGVGTKLLLAKLAGKHDTVGIDLVAMNVNDVLCMGAKPLFFLDYIACGKVDVNVLHDVVKGIAEGCRQAGCSLIGGETAEMPGLYKKNDYDLAGFTVGVVDRAQMIDGSRITEGDKLVGLASSGIHSNGYSLVRKVFSLSQQKKMAKELLTPTRIYVKEVLAAIEKFSEGRTTSAIKGIAHITGGAFYEKLTKILSEGLCFLVDKASWPVPNVFQKIQKQGKIDWPEMYRTFNMGIGMAMVVSSSEAAALKKFMADAGVEAFVIGQVIRNDKRKIDFDKRS